MNVSNESHFFGTVFFDIQIEQAPKSGKMNSLETDQSEKLSELDSLDSDRLRRLKFNLFLMRIVPLNLHLIESFLILSNPWQWLEGNQWLLTTG